MAPNKKKKNRPRMVVKSEKTSHVVLDEIPPSPPLSSYEEEYPSDSLSVPVQTAPNADKKASKPKKKVEVPMAPLVVTLDELAYLLRMSRSAVVRMDNDNLLPGKIRFGGCVRFHLETVKKWLNSLS